MEGVFPQGCRRRGSLVLGSGEGSGRLRTGSRGGRPGCCQGAGAMGPPPPAPRLWRTTGTHCCSCHVLALSVTLSFYLFFPPISLYFSRHCMSTAAKIPLLQQILLGGKKKPQVYCQHSVVSKQSRHKKAFIYISVLSILFF